MLTREEKTALDKVFYSLVYNGERYDVAVPWKSDSPALLNNYEMAYSWLNATEKCLIRQHSEIIVLYVKKGHIRKAQESEKEPQGAWYPPPLSRLLSLNCIWCQCKVPGTVLSLKDEILPGPKLQISLFDMPLHFHCFPIAVVCDVSKMYLLICIPI